MSTAIVLATVSAGIVTAGAAIVSCSTEEGEPTPARPDRDGAPGADANGDSTPPVLGPLCTAIDIPEGAGAKFCDLPGADVPGFTVPPEFCVREFTTTPVKEARVLRFAPNGDLFVAAPSMLTPGGASEGPGAIVVLPDDDHDGKADAVLTYVGPSPTDGTPCATRESNPNDVSCVHGLLFAGDYMYFTRSDEVRRYPYRSGDRVAPGTGSEVVATLGGGPIPDVRWTHGLELTKEGSIYVSRGRIDSSSCSVEEMTRGAVMALHVEVPNATLPLTPELIADGFRNPMYLRCAPNSCGDCYASELSGDNWDSVGGREKLSLLEKRGESWGYPCCVGKDEPLPDTTSVNCANVGQELVAIPLHDTNFGLDFDRGAFPPPYRHGVFIALHGVFTSFGGTGVVWMPTDTRSLRPTGEPKMFVGGFGTNDGTMRGRATDAVFAPDGRLFVADDTLGKIYWIAPRTLRAPR